MMSDLLRTSEIDHLLRDNSEIEDNADGLIVINAIDDNE